MIERKKLASSLTFTSTSTPVTLFNVSNGTVTTPGSITITGLGKSSILTIEKTGTITLTAGGVVPTNPIAPSTGPTVIAGCYPSNANYRLYPAPYNCVEVPPGNGNYCESTCGQVGVTPSCNKRYYFIPQSPPICYDLGPGAFGGTHCESTCGGQVGAPTATEAPPTATEAPPTATPTTGPSVSATIAFSMSPNPATTSQSLTFSATVTGSGCVPSGYVDFFRDNQSTRFVAATTGSTNPGTATYSGYPASVIGVGTHPVYAKYVPSSRI